MKKPLRIIPFFLLTIFSAKIINAQNWLTTGNSNLTNSNFLGTKDNTDLIFKVNNTERGRLAAAGFWRLGTATNYAKVDSSGKLTFGGTGVYQVAGNKYAFQYSGNPNYGLFFNSSSVQYEFRNGSAIPVFSINANTGNSVFNGTVKVGAYTLPSADGSSGQVLTTNGLGTVNWSTVSGGGGYTAGTGISITGNTITNTAPDKTVTLTGIGATTVSGTYPNFTISSTDNNTTYTAGTGISISGTTISSTVTGSQWTTVGNNIVYSAGDALIHGLTFGIGGGNNPSNTAVGDHALISNPSGIFNTAVGYNTLYLNTTGSNNTANGGSSLFYNTTGSNNTAIGDVALYSNTTGNGNTALGEQALGDNTTGGYNTASGYNVLLYNTTGSDNTASGYGALYTNTTGGENAAFGEGALYANTSGSNNTSIGIGSLNNNSIGSFNTAIGSNSLQYSTTGQYNSAIGSEALLNTTTGNYNAAIGNNALYSNTTGGENSALGYNAYPIDGTVNNYTGMGYDVGTTASTSNEVEIGNSSVSVIRGEVNFSTYSDKRIKNNIQQNVPGLSFINKLTPVTYKLDIHKENDMMYAGKTFNGKSEKDVDFAGKYDLEKKQMTGFLAQDVEAAAEAVHYDFSGVVKPRNEHDLYSLRYSDFVVPLVKAVQELSKMNDAKEAKIDTLQKQLNNLRTLVLSIQQQQQSCSPCSAAAATNAGATQSYVTIADGTLLEQNIPNPFNSTTRINYTLPQKFANAQIIITDKTGKTLKAITISGSGKGTVNVDASTLSSGAYQYSLIVDGRLIDTKQMVLAK